ncbi:MAG: hypothetical protein J5I90_07605 [Caldilineales bacterium]|nr:hypothetical protein [Caldilineales bacterium]
MNIALDFDGTIADAAGAKIRYAKERWNIELTYATSMRPGALPLMGEERYEQMLRDVFGSPMSVEMEPMPGAVESLRRLASDHDLHIVTARFDHEGEFAMQWLEKHGLSVRSLTATNRGAKVDHCVALNASVLFEDSVGELAHFANQEHTVAMALLETPYNQLEQRAEDWHVVPDWTAFEALVGRLAHTT